MRSSILGPFVFLSAIQLGAALAEGIDQSYVKPDSERSFGEVLLSELGYAGYEKGYALVVGISEYSSFASLPTKQDPIKIRDYLLNEAGFDYVHVLTDEKATLSRINQLMLEYFPEVLDDNDRFVLYWSGHGVTRTIRRGSEGYLPLAGTASADSYASMISMSEFKRWDSAIPAQQVLYILDSCFSGHASFVPQADGPRLETIEMLARPSRHILTAGEDGQQTIAVDALGGSIFTAAVLDGLKGSADAANAYPKDGIISLSELLSYVKRRVDDERREYNWSYSITPQLRYLETSTGEFFFVSSAYKNERLVTSGLTPSGQFRHGEAVPKAGTAKHPSEEPPAASDSRYIVEIQEVLASLGYEPGTPDGFMGLRTRGAILRFQQDSGLEGTGQIDTATVDALSRAWASRASNDSEGSAASAPDRDAHADALDVVGDTTEMRMALSNNYDKNVWRHAMLRSWDRVAQRAVADHIVAAADSFTTAENQVSEQADQIRRLVVEGYDAIVLNAASTDDLNDAVKEACDAGVVVVSFDGIVTEPCAWRIGTDFRQLGKDQILYLKDRIEGQCNLLEIRGLSGVSVDNEISRGIHDGVAEYPNFKVVASVNGNWDQTTTETAVASILPTLPEICAVVTQGGDGYGAARAFAAAGRPIPVILLGNRHDELRWWKERKNITGYETMSASIAPGVSTIAFWVAQQILAGRDVPKDLILPLLRIDQDTIDAEFAATAPGEVTNTEYSLVDAHRMIERSRM